MGRTLGVCKLFLLHLHMGEGFFSIHLRILLRLVSHLLVIHCDTTLNFLCLDKSRGVENVITVQACHSFIENLPRGSLILFLCELPELVLGVLQLAFLDVCQR